MVYYTCEINFAFPGTSPGRRERYLSYEVIAMVGGISGVGGMGYVGPYYRSRAAEGIRGTQNAARQGVVMGTRKAASPETPVQPVTAARPVSRNDVSVPELTSRLENDPAAMAGRMRMQRGDVSPEGIFAESGKNGSPVQAAKQNALEGQLFRAEDAMNRNDLKGAEEVLRGGAPDLPGLPEEDTLPGLPKDDALAGLPEQKDSEAPEGVKSGAQGAQEALEEGECQTCEGRKYQDGSDDMGVSYQTPTNIKPEQAASAVRGHEMEHVYREQAKAQREGRKVVSQNVTMHTEICPECGKAYVSGGTTRTVTKADTDSNAQQDAQQQQQNGEEQKLRTPFSAVA